jgi:hemerythrin-like metal-binding protein
MPLIPWRDEFAIGIPDVDHEHYELIQLINQLHDEIGIGADPAEIEAFLGEVYAKIEAHFALEESIMRAQRYDQFGVHKADHERLLDEIRDIMDAVTAGAVADYRSTLSDTVREWFVAHFQSHDARLHRALNVFRH